MRKLLTCLLIAILLTVVLFFLVYKTPWAVQPYVYCIYGMLLVTVGFAYIGGNVWSKWVKSKYFRAELLNGNGKAQENNR